jgi:hypothetical protein
MLNLFFKSPQPILELQTSGNCPLGVILLGFRCTPNQDQRIPHLIGYQPSILSDDPFKLFPKRIDHLPDKVRGELIYQGRIAKEFNRKDRRQQAFFRSGGIRVSRHSFS